MKNKFEYVDEYILGVYSEDYDTPDELEKHIELARLSFDRIMELDNFLKDNELDLSDIPHYQGKLLELDVDVIDSMDDIDIVKFCLELFKINEKKPRFEV